MRPVLRYSRLGGTPIIFLVQVDGDFLKCPIFSKMCPGYSENRETFIAKSHLDNVGDSDKRA
jgi:hypothetical protein